MKINKSCRTCEFCHPNSCGAGFVCTSVNYGEPIDKSDQDQPCWEIGFRYWCELIDMLSPEQRHVFEAPYPSMQKKEFQRVGVKTELEYLLFCIEQK